MQWYLQAFSKFSDFSGRARRTEYWTFTLIHWLILTALYILFLSGGDNPSTIFLVVAMLYLFAGLIPALAVTVRRLHDIGRSGVWFFVAFIPLVGGLILLVLLVSDGELADNRWGANPKQA